MSQNDLDFVAYRTSLLGVMKLFDIIGKESKGGALNSKKKDKGEVGVFARGERRGERSERS